jgi:hypothetical protein
MQHERIQRSGSDFFRQFKRMIINLKTAPQIP